MLSFDEYAAQHPPGSRYLRAKAWVRADGLALYVRRSVPFRQTDYDLASVEADQPKTGALTRFLDRYEPLYSFYLENVLVPELVGFYLRRGYERVPGTHILSPCFRKPGPW